MGEKTFGKASVQVLVDLKNGGALVITTAKYLTPSKVDISDKGVAPDVLVQASAEDEKTRARRATAKGRRGFTGQSRSGGNGASIVWHEKNGARPQAARRFCL